MALAAFILTLFVAGHALSTGLWRADVRAGRVHDCVEPPELLLSSAICALALGLGLNWALALGRVLAFMPLLAGASLLGCGGGYALVRRSKAPIELEPREPGLPVPRWLVYSAAAPVIVWVAFALARGWFLPVCSHDALSYHMPKAAFLVRGHGYEWFTSPDFRLTSNPCNYELLVADVIILTGGDRVTEWIGTASYLLFILGGCAIVQRWWGRGLHVVACGLALGALPVALLHSGAHKNDLLASALILSAFLWAGRFYAQHSRAAAILTVLGLGMAWGTKSNAWLVGVAVVVICTAGLIRRARAGHRPTRREVVGLLAVCAIAAVLLGGVPYWDTFVHVGSPVGREGRAVRVGYGDWANLWRYPALLLLAPFSPRLQDVWVPWRNEYWFWPRYEIYFSNYGALFSVLAVTIPLVVHRYRGAPGAVGERGIVSVLALATFLLFLPIKGRPLGVFANNPRYLLFIAPIAIAWSLAPLARRLAAKGRAGRRASYLLVLTLSVLFATEALDFGQNDAFAPWAYVVHCVTNPGTREPSWMVRAGTVVDRLAGPDETVAVDGAFDTWIYPALGRDLTRPIVFVKPGPGPVVIPEQASWVMVDRSWAKIWGHPGLTDMGQFHRYIGRGEPTEDDVRVLTALLADPRFRLVYWDRGANQAVFHRVPSGA